MTSPQHKRTSRQSNQKTGRLRLGLALLWAVVSTAVVALLAVAMAPRLGSVLDQASVADAYSLLAEIDSGVNAFELNVHAGNITSNQFPGRISQLSSPIVPASRNSCGDAMSGNAQAQWASTGPFIRFYADTSGVPTGIGRIRDSIERTVPPASNPLVLRIPGVNVRLARLLDRLVDKADGATVGKVVFDSLATDTVSIRYLIIPRQSNKC